MNLKEEIKKASEYYALTKTHKNRAWVSVGLRQEDHDKIKLLAKECKLNHLCLVIFATKLSKTNNTNIEYSILSIW